MDAPIWRLSGWWLEVKCASCARSTFMPLRLLSAEIGWDVPLGKVSVRLRCPECHQRPTYLALVDRADGGPGSGTAKRKALVIRTAYSRLPWTRGAAGGFIACPDGVEGHSAIVYRDVTRPVQFWWVWRVDWPNRFTVSGACPTKQEAADEATAWWWHLVETEPPEREPEKSDQEVIAELLDAAPERPVDFDLTSRSTEWLQKLNAEITRRWRDEIRREQTPAPIAEVMRQASEILYRRRIGGKG